MQLRKFTWRVGLAAALVCLLGVASPGLAAAGDHPKLDTFLNKQAGKGGKTQVIVTLNPGWSALGRAELARLGTMGRELFLLNAHVLEVSNGQLKKLADHPAVLQVDWDRPTAGEASHATTSIGSKAVRYQYGYTGSGIGVAVIDSGITSSHPDLLRGPGHTRVVGWQDFVNGRTTPYDDFGHGTHVAGIIAGNGLSSAGLHAGVAAGVNLVGLKVLDHRGFGTISQVIAALDFAVANRALYNIRVINMSVGAAVTESYYRDPLTLSVKRAVDAGIVVVAAAGNRGRDAEGRTLYGGITAPGNAPWVLTVGASSTQGTPVRYDDVVAGYSSRGPTAVDFLAKPDLVAPGTGIVSLVDPSSTFYSTKAGFLVKGTSSSGTKPYLSLSGTSMATPVVSGTVALMLQANPALTPNLVKALLQYTAQAHPGYDAFTQGAGFLNAKGAVDLARFFANPGGRPYPRSVWWGRRLHWGNQRIGGGLLLPTANAWKPNVVWGAAFTPEGDNIVWGTRLEAEADNIVWGTSFQVEADNIVWGTAVEADNIVWGTRQFFEADNIVWGTDCGGRDCFNIVWGTSSAGEADNIVWGTADELQINNIVWGTQVEADNIVWGTNFEQESDNIVWGTNFEQESDNIVWGTSFAQELDNIVWGTSFAQELDNIVWGTGSAQELDNIVWGTSFDAAQWGSFTRWLELTFELLFAAPAPATSGSSGTTSSTGGGF